MPLPADEDSIVVHGNHFTPHWRQQLERLYSFSRSLNTNSFEAHILLGSLLCEIKRGGDLEGHTELFRFARAHLSQGLSVHMLARHRNMERTAFTRWFEQEVGISPGRWLRILRLHCAAVHLQTRPNISIQQIMHELGMGNASSSSRSFKDYFGLSPSAYRQLTFDDKKRVRQHPPGLDVEQTTFENLELLRLLP